MSVLETCTKKIKIKKNKKIKKKKLSSISNLLFRELLVPMSCEPNLKEAGKKNEKKNKKKKKKGEKKKRKTDSDRRMTHSSKLAFLSEQELQ